MIEIYKQIYRKGFRGKFPLRSRGLSSCNTTGLNGTLPVKCLIAAI